MGSPLQSTSLGELGGSSPLLSTSLGELVAVIFIDDGAGGKIWLADPAATLWDALEAGVSWTAACDSGQIWEAERVCD